MKYIMVVGTGVTPALHMSREAMAEISTADKILYYSHPDLDGILQGTAANLIPLDRLYPDGGIDIESFDRIAECLIGELEDANKVALLQHGHPEFGVSLTEIIRARLSHADVIVRSIPGISSFDSMIVDNRRDPLEWGTVLLDVNRLLLFETRMDITLDYYLYHVSSILTRRTNFINPADSNEIASLQDYLLRFYPEDHRCFLVRSGVGEVGASRREQCDIGALETALDRIDFETSLFVPAVKRGDVNEAVLTRLMVPH